MKILIAGKGFVGEAVGERLEDGHEVKYLDRNGAEFEQDITEEFELEESFDVLIHTVGLAPGFSTPEEYRKVHVEGTENLVDAVDCDKVVYLSALGVGEVDHSFFRTKEEAEELVKDSGKDFTVLRPSTVFGKGNRLLDLMRKFAPLRVFPDVPAEVQPILLEDLVSVVEEVVDSHGGETLNCAGPDRIGLFEMAKSIYAEEGFMCLPVPAPEFLMELKLSGLSFLGPPFTRENIEIFRARNVTEDNDAAEIVELGKVFE